MIKIILKTASLGLLFVFSACNLTQNSTEEKQSIQSTKKIEIAKATINESSVKEELEFLTSNDLMGRNTGSE